MPATAARARCTSAAVTVIAGSGVRERNDGVDLDLRSLGQRRDRVGDAGGRIGREERRVDLVDGGERVDVGEVHGDPHRVGQLRAGRGHHGLEVDEALVGLLGGSGPHDLTAVGVQRDLAGAEQQAAGADRVAVRTDRGWSAERRHDFTVMGHRRSLHPVRAQYGGSMRVPRWLVPAIALASFATTASPVAAATVEYGTCSDEPSLECGTLAVPLDWTGATPGTITLDVRRLKSSGPPATRAIVPLAGGPGQAATPFASSFASSLAAGLGTRDLLVYDQRGTGRSGPLRCGALTRRGLSEAEAIRQCAEQLGSARGFFRTADSVVDIEALRIAGGYEKLLFYGVSYGTKVALAYAAAYPQRVEGMILDSALPADGPDTLRRGTFASLGRVVGELCAKSACSDLRQSITSVLGQSARKLAKRRASGKVTAPDGSRVSFRVAEQDLFDVLLAGDLNPALRAELPGSLRAFLDGDRTPLTRLSVRAQGLTGVATQQLSLPDNDVLFLATRCEESFFPWDRNASRSTRIAQARSAIAAPSGGVLRPVQQHRRPELRDGGAVRELAGGLPRPGTDRPASAGPHVDPGGIGRPPHAPRQRTGHRRSDPGRPGAERAVRRPLRARQRAAGLRRPRRRGVLPAPAGRGLPGDHQPVLANPEAAHPTQPGPGPFEGDEDGQRPHRDTRPTCAGSSSATRWRPGPECASGRRPVVCAAATRR